MRTIKKTLKGMLIIAIATVSITGCEKYDEGGLISKAEKRLTANTWKLDKYLRNGNDETSQLLISNFTEDFSESKTLTRSYTDKDGDAFSETGTWTFANDKQQIKLTGVSSIELTDETSTVSTSDYNIVKLIKDELWYSYENGGDSHEFHFIPN
ncbi:MAG: hypothetical protein O3C22_09010 [Bacteroidetes bacterium]|nr:hypothetical protein [Bacteroidota bacterium]MDA1112475.1 hypothetical protein [Bacteroidota bacterium]